MADISKIKIGDEIFNIKDEELQSILNILLNNQSEPNNE